MLGGFLKGFLKGLFGFPPELRATVVYFGGPAPEVDTVLPPLENYSNYFSTRICTLIGVAYPPRIT